MKLEAERKARHDAEADQKALVQKAKEVAELTVKLEGERKARHDAEAAHKALGHLAQTAVEMRW